MPHNVFSTFVLSHLSSAGRHNNVSSINNRCSASSMDMTKVIFQLQFGLTSFFTFEICKERSL